MAQVHRIVGCLRRALVVGPVAAVLASAALAAEPRSFVIPPTDGYGIDECLARGGDCARMVANSWCAAHGLSTALTFGRAEDVTAAIAETGAAVPVQPGSFVVNCIQ
jgi:hypothetical protein